MVGLAELSSKKERTRQKFNSCMNVHTVHVWPLLFTNPQLYNYVRTYRDVGMYVVHDM